MKTKLFLLIGIMLVSVIAFGQIDLRNSSSANIKVTSTDGLNMLEVPAGQTASIPFLKEINGIVKVKIKHSAYRPGAGFTDINDGEFSLAINNGTAVFSSPKQKQADGSSASTVKKFGKWRTTPAGTQPIVVGGKTVAENRKEWPSPSNFDGVDFIVKNLCSMTIIGYSDPLTGLCLKAGDKSSTKIKASTGNFQTAICYDTDPDSTATGKNRKWAVLDKAIYQGMDTLRIYNTNLTLANSGKKVIKTFRNRTSLGYLIINDGFVLGKKTIKTISPNSIQKMEFYEGWNVIVLQHQDKNGYPYQEAILIMVTEKGGILDLSEKIGTGTSISKLGITETR